MGQQQLLLIILGVIIVGIAVAVGITMFQDNAISANKDAVANDLVQLAAKAQQYYRRPIQLGGGGNSFTPAAPGVPLTSNLAGMQLLVSDAFSNNQNGIYKILSVADTLIVLQGTGKTQDSEGEYPQIEMDVSGSQFSLKPPWTAVATLPTP